VPVVADATGADDNCARRRRRTRGFEDDLTPRTRRAYAGAMADQDATFVALDHATP
jgi:hypothetical protein